MPCRLSRRRQISASSARSNLRFAVGAVFLPNLLLLSSCLLTPTLCAATTYGDGQPAKERARQHSGERSSRGDHDGEVSNAEGSKARAATSQRQSRESRQGRSGASTGTADRQGEGAKGLDSATETRRDSDRKTPDVSNRVSAEQQANVQQLQADLQVLAHGVQGADDEIRALAESLQSMSPHSPDPALVEDLASDLAAAVADGSLSPREMAALAAAVEDVLQSAGLSSADVAVLIQDVEAILEAADVGRAEVQAVVHDLQAIAHTLQAPAGGAKTSSSSSRRRGRGRS